MAITTLDPKTALVIVDLQKGIVGMPTAHPAATIVGGASRLARAFRERDLPVVLVNVAGVPPGRTERRRSIDGLPPDWFDLVPELDLQQSDLAVTKRTWGAFTGTDLDVRLKALGVTQLVVVGISTSIGVESTARQAHELGYHVALATDAMTDLNLDAHENSISRIFPGLGETGSTQDIIDLLEGTQTAQGGTPHSS